MLKLRRLVRPAVLVATLVTLTATAGCGLGTANGFTPSGKLAGPLQDVKRLNGLSIAVGSKNFSEQLLLGKMSVILLKSAGADVKDYSNIPGSASARQAELTGDVGLQWEYTGTAWIEYLGHANGIPDKTKQYDAVRKQDLKENNLAWLKPAPMNNTYGFATTAEKAKKLGISKLSDIKRLPMSQRTFCVESEFRSRNDGFEPMLKRYGMSVKDLPKGNIKTLATGAIYAATDKGACNFGEIFTTDGRIQALNLTVLQDDRKFFPNYSVCPVFRKEILDQYPQLKQLFGPVAAKLDNTTLRKLNAQIDVDGRQPSDVAYDWLKKQGFLACR